MAWPFGNKQNQSEEDAKKELDGFIDRIGASLEVKLEEKLKPIREQVSEVKTKWDALETAAANGGGSNGGGGEGGGGGVDDTQLTEGQKRTLYERKMLAATILTNARITEGEVLGEVVGQGLGEFVPKIKKYFAETPVERKGQADYPEYCRNCVDLVIGREARSGGLRFDGQNKKFFLEDAGGKGGETQYDFLAGDQAWVDPRSGKIVSASEQLAKLGIKPEEFAESVKKGVV